MAGFADMRGVTAHADPSTILTVSDLHVRFPVTSGNVEALSGFDLRVNRGQMAALVGESGCGKSVAAWSILNLLPSPGRIVSGEVRWHGEDVQRMPAERLRHEGRAQSRNRRLLPRK